MARPTITVDGIDLANLGWCLMDGASWGEPTPKTYTVDIPGGNGVIDLTTALAGDVVYNNRADSFSLVYIGNGDFKAAFSALMSTVHGRRLPYVLSFDNEYTRTGRFTIGTPTWYKRTVVVPITVDADPYRSKGTQSVTIAAGGGAVASVLSGRKVVKPVFTCNREFEISIDGYTVHFQAGSWQSPYLVFQAGANEVYANSAVNGGTATIADYAADTIASHATQRISELCWGDDKPSGDAYNVGIAYEWSDL